MMNYFILTALKLHVKKPKMFSSPAVTLMLLHVIVQFIVKMSFYELCDDVMIDDMQIHSWIQQITVIAVRLLQDLTVKSLQLTSFPDCAADWLRPAEALWTNHVLLRENKGSGNKFKQAGLNYWHQIKDCALKEFGPEGSNVFVFLHQIFKKGSTLAHFHHKWKSYSDSEELKTPSDWLHMREATFVVPCCDDLCLCNRSASFWVNFGSGGSTWHWTSSPLCTFSLWKVMHVIPSRHLKLKRTASHCRCIKPPDGRGIRAPCTSGWDAVTKHSNKLGMRNGSWEYDAPKLLSWGVNYKVESVWVRGWNPLDNREECSRGGETEGGMETGGERRRGPPGSCFAEVSTPDKVFITLGQFSADIQELHATRPLMKVSWPNSTEPLRLSWSKSTFSTSCCDCTSDWEPQHQPGRLINHNVQPLLPGMWTVKTLGDVTLASYILDSSKEEINHKRISKLHIYWLDPLRSFQKH